MSRESGYRCGMADSTTDRIIDDVAEGDIVSLPDRTGAYKVVHRESGDAAILVTFEGDDGETFQLQLPAGTPVRRSLESKWESAQSPTPHS